MAVVKADNEDRQKAMFRDNKLRLLMTLVGFSRLGEENDPDATWVIPSSLTAAELSEAIDLIRKFEFDPPVYEDGKTAQDLLRYKNAGTRQSTRKAEFDDDSNGVDDDSEEDRGEYAPDRLSSRNSNGKKILKRRRRAETPQELDEEERERRAYQRRQNDLEKQRKIKSTMFVHDSDEEEDEERDREFFEREQALREKTTAQFKQSLALGSTELASSRKRKGDAQAKKESKRRKTPPKRRSGPFDTDESEEEASDEDAVHVSSRATSQEAEDVLDTDSEEEATDTPLSSQHAAAGDTNGSGKAPKTSAVQDSVMADVDDDDEDEDAGPTVRRAPVRTRGGFIIDDSDSE